MTTYTYDEALKASTEYFNGDDLAARVFVDKYALRNEAGDLLEETPKDMHMRIAGELARIQKTKLSDAQSKQDIFALLDQFKYIIPQGSPMYGIGNKYQYISIGNCFVIESPEDSYGSILKADEQIAQISKRRGGVGVDISNLRPEGSRTQNSSRTSTGILSFMERFSNTIREVGQNGRRGALMITLSVHHPQILDFCRVKNDLTRVTGANISIRLSDEFLKAVENDEEYEQRWPIKGRTKIKNKVNAREVWDEIVQNARDMAEPGILFWDNIVKESPADCYDEFKTISTNPCQPGWAPLIKNYHGNPKIATMDDIGIGDQIWSKDGWTFVTDKMATGNKEVFKYTTTAGVFYGTEDHKIVTNNENLKQKACEAESIEIIVGPLGLNNRSRYSTLHESYYRDVMDGLVLGDGSVHKASGNLIGLYIGDNDQDYFTDDIRSLIGNHRPGISEKFYEVKTNITPDQLCETWNRRVPQDILYNTSSRKIAFLRGLYSANGSVCGNRITLKSTSKGLIEDVQIMLSSLGIRSYFTTNKPTNKPTKIQFDNGEYECKESYDLNISVDREQFVNRIGFIQQYKYDKIKIVESNRVKTVFDIISVESCGHHNVYDITVDNPSHTYWTGGCNVSNCAELPLSAGDACRLLTKNTLSYVVNPFTPEAYFDYQLFYEHAHYAQRYMDDIVDLEIEHIQRIIEKIKSDPECEDARKRELSLWHGVLETCENGRRCGIGITALGDALAALGHEYGSDESIAEAEKIYCTLKLGAYNSSVELAEKLGAFPLWDADKEKNCPFLKRIKQDKVYDHEGNLVADGAEIYAAMQIHGRRNISLLTIAPTGSVSTQTRTTSGVEPAFLLQYTRRKKGNPGDNNFRTDFVDQNGDCWQEFTVYHPTVSKWMEITGETDVENSPWHGCCAMDLDWRQRVKLQAAMQKHCDHAISSTVNLPEDVTTGQVKEIYETAWKAGCKGITIYRDNCRTGVLVSDTAKEEVTHVKRPQDLPCEVYHLTVKGDPYFVLIGLLDGKPYELWAGRNGFLDPSLTSGIVHKMKRPKCYRAEFDDGSVIQPITAACNENEEALTRMISMALRHGAEIQYVVDQLQKTQGPMTSLAKAMARALKKHVPDGSQSTQTCVCGSKMIYQEGCCLCPGCGASRCG